MTKVFQYGSNASSARLNGPNRLQRNAKPLGKAQTVEDFDIVFDVYSFTNQCAASDIVPTEEKKVWGILYDIPDDWVRGKWKDRRTLAQIEGPHYRERKISVERDKGRMVEAITFVVKEESLCFDLATSVWYVSWIVYGLREHSVPEEYIAHVIDVAIETNLRAGENSQKQIDLMKKL
ncbi:MAG: gamma-glutamylcyclotransferase family protein [Candidatus Thorarchaeota archaeon]|jgi:hypothetical protein